MAPTKTQLDRELSRAGGDIEFLIALEVMVESYPRVREPVDPESLKKIRYHARELRHLIERRKMTLGFYHDLLPALVRAEEWAGGCGSELDKRIPLSVHGVRRRNRPPNVKVYAWLGGLIPYTASLDGRNGRPMWAWINRWVPLMVDLPAGTDIRKLYWDKLHERWRHGNGVDDRTIAAVRDGVVRLLEYRCENDIEHALSRPHGPLHQLRDRRVRRPWPQTERRYLEAVERHMPFLKDFFGKLKSLPELRSALKRA